MEDITEYIVVWLYQIASANDGRFLQGSQSFETAKEAIAFSDELKGLEAEGTPYNDELVSHITIVDQVGRDISTQVAQ